MAERIQGARELHLVLLLVVVFLAGPATLPTILGSEQQPAVSGGERYTDKNAGFQLQLPPSWRKEEAKEGLASFRRADGKLVLRVAMDRVHLTPELILRAYERIFTSTILRGPRKILEEEATVSGLPARKLVFGHEVNGEVHRISVVVVLIQGEYWSLMVSGPEALLGSPDQAAFQEVQGIIASFQFAEAVLTRLKKNLEARAYYDRGFAYYKKGDYEGAIAAYGQALKTKPDYAPAYVDRGMAYLAKSEHDRAIADFNQAVVLAPDEPVARYNRGNAYQAKGNHERAIEDYSQAIKLDPEYAKAYTNRGASQYQKHNYDGAIADFDQALRLAPDDGISYHNRGLAYAAKGDKAKARRDFENVLKLINDPGRVQLVRSEIEKLGRARKPKSDDAEVYDLRPAGAESAAAPQQLKPGDAVGHYQRGRELLGKGDTEGAAAAFREAIRLKSDYAEAHTTLGMVYMGQGKRADAIEEFKEAIRTDPNQAFAHLFLGNLLLVGASAQASELAEARKHYEAYLKLALEGKVPGIDRALAISAAYFQLGNVDDKMGREKEAMENYHQGLKANPNDSELLNNIAWLYATAKDPQVRNPQKALEYAKRAVALTDQMTVPPEMKKHMLAGHLDTLAEAYYVSGQFDEAIETEKKALANEPNCNPCKEQLKKFEQAKRDKGGRK